MRPPTAKILAGTIIAGTIIAVTILPVTILAGTIPWGKGWENIHADARKYPVPAFCVGVLSPTPPEW